MRTRWNLADQDWTLRGWRQNDWEHDKSMLSIDDGAIDIPSTPARVPGSVRGALSAAGITPSPYLGTRSRDSEWIEHRHWTYSTTLPAEAAEAAAGSRLVLVAESLDYAGVVLIDDTRVGAFEGSILPAEFDVTDAVAAGGRLLTIVFTRVPSDLGQIGRTSLIREWKARYHYGWDWTPRIVQVGIAGPIALEARDGALLDDLRVLADFDSAAGTGSLRVRARATTGGQVATMRVNGPSHSSAHEVPADDDWHSVDLGPVEPWTVHNAGEQTLYTVTASLADGADEHSRRVGFRQVHWRETEGAPAGAEPWLLELNGVPTFLAGVNWVPIRPDYADVTEDDYRIRMSAYRDLGVVILRVWGGAPLEQAVFYDLADEYGLLVWQELPLSSSGIDNHPPEDDAFVADLVEIAESYARRLSHHAALLLWSGGNELIAPDWVPLTVAHPALAAAERIFAVQDPGRRFIATSPLGPRFSADEKDYGTGVHHDVHGPWEFDGTLDEWTRYWDGDDATLRSEVGMSGASGMAMLERYDLVGPTATAEDRVRLRQLWTHSSSWWLGEFQRWDGSGTLADWVLHSQTRQAEWLGYAARATRNRFPRVGGFIVWLGHDTFPCAVSLSVLDYDGAVKPVGAALRQAFAGEDVERV